MQVQADWLEQRYDFAAWREQDEAEPSLVGVGFRFRGDELPGWHLHRSRAVHVVGVPPAALSIWTPAGGGAGLLAVDVWESATAEAARAQLLRVLGEFQGPILEREPAVGDIAFRSGSAAVAFVRGNYTALVRSVEREPVAVGGVAQSLDQAFVAAPESAGAGPLRDVSAADIGDVRPGQRIPLDLDLEQPADGTYWIRFFARSGRILIEAGRAWYVAGPAGPEAVTVVATDPAGTVSRTVIRFRRESA